MYLEALRQPLVRSSRQNIESSEKIRISKPARLQRSRH